MISFKKGAQNSSQKTRAGSFFVAAAAMFSYKIDDIALLELRDVERVYVTYFARFGEYAKGER